MAFARIHIMGNLTRDVELRDAGGTPLASFSIAVNKKYKDKETVSFIDCKAWGKTGELIAQYFTKGKAIHVSGEIEQENWETKDGTKRSKLVANVREFDFLPGGKAEGQDDGAYTKAARAKAAAEVPGSVGDGDIPF